MLKRSLLLATVAALAMTLGLPAMAPAAPAACNPEWPQAVKIGLIPTEGGADIMKRFQPLMEHLQRVLGIKVEAFSASDYAGIITAMAHKHIDFAYFGPKSYTDAADQAGAQAVALEMNKDKQAGYYGIIIVKKGSGIKSMEQTKGKTFAFTDPNSTSAFLVPNILFTATSRPSRGVLQQDQLLRLPRRLHPGGQERHRRGGGHQQHRPGPHGGEGQASLDDFDVLWRSELIPGSPMPRARTCRSLRPPSPARSHVQTATRKVSRSSRTAASPSPTTPPTRDPLPEPLKAEMGKK